MDHGSHRDDRSLLFGLFRRRPLRRLAPRVARLRSAESLERRQMLAADVEFDGGRLLITGSEKADKIFLSAGPEDGTVVIRGLSKKSISFSGVNTIVVDSRGGNDDIRIRSEIRDVAGNLIGITVNAGNGNDRVMGGDGDDDISGGLGKDTIRGGDGDDEISGGGGNDDCRGNAGDDDIFGDAGRDVLRGGDGDDSLSGGDEKDAIFGESGDDSLDGDEGRDRLFGGSGNDDDYDDDGFEDEDEEDDDDGDGDGDGDGDDAGDDPDDDGDDSDDDGDDSDDDGDDSDDDSPSGSTVEFVNGSATVTGTSADEGDKRYYVFTAPATGLLTVSLQPGDGGRYADLELEDVLTGNDLLELEPSEHARTTGTVGVTAGRQYRMRLRSPDREPVNYTVDLTVTSA